jgi:hypothetical protein
MAGKQKPSAPPPKPPPGIFNTETKTGSTGTNGR